MGVRVAMWAVAASLGLVGVMAWSPGTVAVGAVAAVLGGVGGYALGQRGGRVGPLDHAPRVEASWRTAAGHVAVGALAGPAFVLVMTGLTTLLGAAAVPVAALVVAAVVWRHRRRAALATVVATGDLAGLSNADLQREWHRSHAALAMAPDAAALALVQDLRRRQLDEMERRHPDGFRRWAGSGNWITGATAPFLGS